MYKEILINAKLEIGKRGQKTEIREVQSGGEGPHCTGVPYNNNSNYNNINNNNNNFCDNHMGKPNSNTDASTKTSNGPFQVCCITPLPCWTVTTVWGVLDIGLIRNCALS